MTLSQFKSELSTVVSQEPIIINELLHMAERALNFAKSDTAFSEQWYDVAIEIYDLRDEINSNKLDSNAMMLRLRLIKTYGAEDPRSIIYIDRIQKWIKDVVQDLRKDNLNYEHWMKLPVNEIRELRKIKMRLKMAVELQSVGIKIDEEVSDLCSIIINLP
jgi:hypothetical protein